MTGSCSAVRSTFRGMHRITQSVCAGLVNRATYSLSEMPSTASSRLLSVRFDCPGGVRASFQNCPSAFFKPRRMESPSQYGPRHAAYDLKKLRGKDIVHRIG